MRAGGMGVETGQVLGDEDEKEGDEIERILSLVPVPSV